jgi:hypothetical protein
LVDSERLGDDQCFSDPPLKDLGGEVAERRITALASGDNLDEGKESAAGLGRRAEGRLGQAWARLGPGLGQAWASNSQSRVAKKLAASAFS